MGDKWTLMDHWNDTSDQWLVMGDQWFMMVHGPLGIHWVSPSSLQHRGLKDEIPGISMGWGLCWGPGIVYLEKAHV